MCVSIRLANFSMFATKCGSIPFHTPNLLLLLLLFFSLATHSHFRLEVDECFHLHKFITDYRPAQEPRHRQMTIEISLLAMCAAWWSTSAAAVFAAWAWHSWRYTEEHFCQRHYSLERSVIFFSVCSAVSEICSCAHMSDSIAIVVWSSLLLLLLLAAHRRRRHRCRRWLCSVFFPLAHPSWCQTFDKISKCCQPKWHKSR